MEANFYVYKKKKKAHQIADAMVKGFGATKKLSTDDLSPGVMMTYGVWEECSDLIKICEKTGSDYLYIDNSYFNQTRKEYYRLVKNGRLYHETKDRPSDRWEKLNIKLKPWKKTGSKIIIAPILRLTAETVLDLNIDKWIEDTIKILSENTDREIIVKWRTKIFSVEKGRLNQIAITKPKLRDYLTDAHALVTTESNSSIESIIHGVPIFCGNDNPVHRIAESDLSKIETPIYPDREQVLWNLAYQQFTIPEMASGFAKEILYGS
jgi:hypothetical protein